MKTRENQNMPETTIHSEEQTRKPLQNTDALNEMKAKRVLILGASPEVLQKVVEQVKALGVQVEGSTDVKQAAAQFDAKDFDLIVFGSGIVGHISKSLRAEFARQKFDAAFLDTFAPVALRQIEATLKGEHKEQKYIKDFRVADDGISDYLLQAEILEPCRVRIEVYKMGDAPAPRIILIAESVVEPGSFECRIDRKQRDYGHIIYTTFNDDEFCLYNMHG